MPASVPASVPAAVARVAVVVAGANDSNCVCACGCAYGCGVPVLAFVRVLVLVLVQTFWRFDNRSDSINCTYAFGIVLPYIPDDNDRNLFVYSGQLNHQCRTPVSVKYIN